MSREPRRGLAAVMFADRVGFTALMGEDEAALATLPSAVEAAKCAVAIQRELVAAPVVPLRIGLHVDDIADEGDGMDPAFAPLRDHPGIAPPRRRVTAP